MTERENTSPFMLMAGLAKGSSIRRIHTLWQNNSNTNVASYGIPDKKIVCHLSRKGRDCLSIDVKVLEQYSMKEAILQAQEILKQL